MDEVVLQSCAALYTALTCRLEVFHARPTVPTMRWADRDLQASSCVHEAPPQYCADDKFFRGVLPVCAGLHWLRDARNRSGRGIFTCVKTNGGNGRSETGNMRSTHCI